MSFSVLGIALIFSIGGLVMVLDRALEPLLNFIGRRWRLSGPRQAFARVEWRSNATLQLQRLAHEHAGAGTWSNAAGANPVTLANEALALLDVSDEDHPLLRAPTSRSDEKSPSSLDNERIIVVVESKLS